MEPWRFLGGNGRDRRICLDEGQYPQKLNTISTMKITKYDFVDGARKAEGITVIIDVFRAFSVACCCFEKGIHRLVPVGTPEEALAFLIEGRDTWLRICSIYCCGTVRSERLKKMVQSAVSDPNPGVAETAALVLGGGEAN